jgi:hypothetical protein
MRKQILFLLILGAAGTQAIAQSFTLSGELRPRLELRHGYRTLPPLRTEMAAFVNQRSRLNLLYETDQFTTFISFQDVRIWGEKGMFELKPGLGMHQAYIEIPFLEKFAVKIGRQELRYNNQRLFGINNWNQFGRTHDAAVLKYNSKGWNVHLGGAFNQSLEPAFGTPYFGDAYKSLNFLWINKKIDHFNISSMLVLDGTQDDYHTSKVNLRSTVGGIVSWKPNENSVELHYYKQGGKSTRYYKIDAWYLSMAALMQSVDRITLKAGIEVFSGGNEDEPSYTTKVFNPLYGANHAFNGHLDYFTNIPEHTRGAGLVNPFVNFSYKLNETTILKADYHFFSTYGNLLDESYEVINKYLGSEIDFGVQLTFSKTMDLQFGYSTMFATKSMEFLKGGSHKEPIHWGWVMLTVKPVFFTSEAQSK